MCQFCQENVLQKCTFFLAPVLRYRSAVGRTTAPVKLLLFTEWQKKTFSKVKIQSGMAWLQYQTLKVLFRSSLTMLGRSKDIRMRARPWKNYETWILEDFDSFCKRHVTHFPFSFHTTVRHTRKSQQKFRFFEFEHYFPNASAEAAAAAAAWKG